MKKIETTIHRTMRADYTGVLTNPEDLQWLRETHVPDLPLETKAVIFAGNEDCPSWIQALTEDSIYAVLLGTWENED